MKSRADIDILVSHLLDQAQARGIFPTPVEAILAAQQLEVSDGIVNLFAPHVVADAPEPVRHRIQTLIEQGKCPLGLLDRRSRVVHIPPDELVVRQRFGLLHEVGHDLCPWQSALVHLHVGGRIDERVAIWFEEEANYAAAHLLFQQQVFEEVAFQALPTFDTICTLAEQFGASLHATFRHYIEYSSACIGGCIIAPGSQEAISPASCLMVKRAIVTRSFRDRYALTDHPMHFLTGSPLEELGKAHRQLALTSSVEGTLVLPSRHAEMRRLHYSLFGNSHHLFWLLHDRMAS